MDFILQEDTNNSDSLQNFVEQRKISSVDDEIAALEKNLGIDRQKIATKEVREREDSVPPEEQDNVILENLKQAGGGVLDSVQETANSVIDFADWMENLAAEKGYGSGDLINSEQDRIEFLSNIVDEPKSLLAGGGLARGMANFLAPYAGLSKVVKWGSRGGKLVRFARAGMLGAAVDFASFDPEEKRLSDFLQTFPSMRPFVVDYLTSKEDDTRLKSRLKNTLEGLGLGLFTDGVFSVLGAYRANRKIKASGGKSILKPEVKAAAEEAAGGAKIEGQAIEPPPIPKTEPPPLPDLKPLAPDGGDFLTIERTTTAKGEDVLTGLTNEIAPSDKAVNLNLNKIKDGADIEKALSVIGDEFRPEIDEARRGTITDEAASKLADDLDISLDQLSQRKLGEAFNAEELIKSRRLLNMSARSLYNKAQVAAKGGDVEMVAFLEALDAHRAIQAHVSGAVAEAGRALRSMRQIVGTADDAVKAAMIDETIKMSGGRDNLKKLIQDIASLESKDLGEATKQLSRLNNRTRFEKLSDAVFTLRVNSLLSSPKTQLVNFLGNSSTIVTKVAERKMGEIISNSKYGSGEVARGEAAALTNGFVNGFNDAMNLAWKSFKEGTATGPTKVDIRPGYSQLGSGSFRDADILGKALQVMQLPSRSLMAADEFFKAINYRMELHSLAFREASNKGLSGEAFAKEMNRILNNPPVELKVKSLQEARINTFTEPLTGNFERIDQIVKSVPGMRHVAPFIRTNVNIARFGLERTPFLRKISDRVTKNLNTGGVARDLEMAKVSLGSGVLAIGSGLAVSKVLTGGGPANINSKKLLEQSGWMPYSIKIGDTYYSYDRLDPVGGLLGLAADFAEIATHIPETRMEDLDELALVMATTVANAYTPEFLTEDIAEVFDIIRDPEKGADKLNRILAKIGAATAIPFSIALRDLRKEADPTRRDVRPKPDSAFPLVESIINEMRNTIPGLSKDLPAYRNIFGEPLHYPTGLGPDLISPIASNQVDESPAFKELTRLGMTGPFIRPEPPPGQEHLMVRMPSRTLSKSAGSRANRTVVSQKLTPAEYDQLVQYSAGIGIKGVKPLKEKLSKLINSSRYKNARNDEVRKVLLKDMIGKYQEMGRAKFMKESPEYRQDVLEGFQERRLKIRERQILER